MEGVDMGYYIHNLNFESFYNGKGFQYDFRSKIQKIVLPNLRKNHTILLDTETQ
jgi:hypothetical protein